MTVRPAACVFLGGIISFIVGCASEPTLPHHAKLDPAEERMMLLTQQVEEQSSQIHNLRAAMEALLARVKNDETPKKVEKAAPQKPKEVDEIVDESDDDSAEPSAEAAADAEAAGEVAEAEKGAAPGLESSEAMKGSTVADSKHEAMHFYYRGLQALEEKRYEEALKSFREFLKAAPNHVYADRAEYLIAETHFLNREFGLVVVETNLLESRYPYSFKIPEAIWHRALAYVGMGQPDGAKQALRDLMRKYPNTQYADRASRKLAELDTRRETRQPPLMHESD